jgi:hypothetical protein
MVITSMNTKIDPRRIQHEFHGVSRFTLRQATGWMSAEERSSHAGLGRIVRFFKALQTVIRQNSASDVIRTASEFGSPVTMTACRNSCAFHGSPGTTGRTGHPTRHATTSARRLNARVAGSSWGTQWPDSATWSDFFYRPTCVIGDERSAISSYYCYDRVENVELIIAEVNSIFRR